MKALMIDLTQQNTGAVNAVTYYNFEAALPVQNTAPILDRVGSAEGFSGPLPPERNASVVLDASLSGVKSQSSDGAKSPADEMRAKIFALENHILSGPQVELEYLHHFATGIYMREMRIPAGTVVTGAIHKTEHLNILTKGEISVWTEDGMKRIQAPAVIPSKPGIKRAGYAHTETHWITVCHNPTDERDTEKLFHLFTTNSYQEFLEFQAEEQKKLQHQGGV